MVQSSMNKIGSRSKHNVDVRPWRSSNKFYTDGFESTLWDRLPHFVTRPVGLKRKLRTSKLCHPYGSYIFDLWSHEKQMQDPRNLFVVALSQGFVVGILLLKPHGKQELYLEALCIEPEFRSKGIADKLLRESIKAAHAKYGPTSILLNSTKEALNLYKRRGFKVMSALEAYAYGMQASDETPMLKVPT